MLKCVIVFIFVLLSNISFAEKELENQFLKNPNVDAFINKMHDRYGFSVAELRAQFGKAVFLENSINRMNGQTESLSWGQYMKLVLTPQKTNDGVKFYKKHYKTLVRAEKKYGVPTHIIAGIIGIETSYANAKLRHRAFDTLATLAFFYPRRSAYFTGELEALLVFAKKENTDPFSYMSSYAGAVGIPQFMPSNVLKYAVDGNYDNKIDIVNDMNDAIFSVANYLNKFGWKSKQPVAVKVRVRGTKYKKFVVQWPCSKKMQTVGALKKVGVKFPGAFANNLPCALFTVNIDEKTIEHHAAFPNFCAIGRYNSSARYIMAVNYLGNRIKARAGIK